MCTVLKHPDQGVFFHEYSIIFSSISGFILGALRGLLYDLTVDICFDCFEGDIDDVESEEPAIWIHSCRTRRRGRTRNKHECTARSNAQAGPLARQGNVQRGQSLDDRSSEWYVRAGQRESDRVVFMESGRDLH